MAVQPKIRPPLPASPPAPAPEAGSSGWGSNAIVFIPTAAMLAMVAAVVLVNEVNSSWVLAPVMLLALVATLAVLATCTRMLADDD